MASEERWQVIEANQLGVGIDQSSRVVLSLDVLGQVPVEARRFRVGISLSPDKARELVDNLRRAADRAESEMSRH
jgi:hypothetical protein